MITRVSLSSVGQGLPKYPRVSTGLPAQVRTPTATDTTSGATYQASVAFTPLTGITTYRVVSSPGGLTATGSASPITVSGLSPATTYTFQVRAENTVGNGAYSSASNSITTANPYALSQTFNASGNYTVPAGKTLMAVLLSNAGTKGGNSSGQNGAAGGAGGNAFGTKDVAVTPGATYVVTIGASSGGLSSFGNLLTGNGSGANYNGTGGGNGGNGGSGNNGGNNSPGVAGNAGNAGGTVNVSDPDIPAWSYGGGGGGGGSGGNSLTMSQPGGAGGNGGSPAGGTGGQGGTGSINGSTNGGTGNAGSAPGGGGGGAGGGGQGNSQVNGPVTGANGGGGRILVYVK